MDLQESIDRFRSPLTGLFVSWGTPAVDAVELAQDCIADAHLSLASCRSDARDPIVFGRWLRGIARNQFREWSRNRSRRQRLGVATATEVLDQIPSKATVVDERLLRLRKEIDRLTSKHREVIMMHYLDETAVADVAALLSISVKSVEGRLYQARKTLRRRVDESNSWTLVANAVLL